MAVTLDLDGSVNKINSKLVSVRENLSGVKDGYDDIGEASKKAVGAAVSGQDKLASSTNKADKALKDQMGIIEKLEGHLLRLEKGQRKAQDVKSIKKYNTEIVKTKVALQSLRTAGVPGIQSINTVAKGSTKIFANLRATLATTFAPLLALGTAAEGIRALVSEVVAYEQTAADLQAITGANGETLEFLKQSAVEVGLSTTISAGKTLEAYKLIASAKPELLSNAEGLAEITREAITLTEAMGGDLPTAATNLTDIMNKFGAEADQANRFVNALAAGSKEGSAEVGQLAAAILVAGTEAKASNVSFEESVGLLEAFAENGLKGAEAGTGFRNILSKLSATDVLPKDALARLKAAGVDIDALSDKSLTFADRLRALQPIQNDSNALTAVFGLENKSAAQILLGNIERVEELTTAVTGTNVAQEQAAIRTATAAGEFAKLKNTILALVDEGGAGLGTLLATLISFVRNGILFMRDRVKDLKPTFDSVVEAVSSLFSELRNLLPAQKEAGEGAGTWGKAIKILNVPLKIFLGLLAGTIKFVTATVSAFSRLIQSVPLLSRGFTRLKDNFFATLSVFSQLPGFVAGGIAAIQTFVVEAGRSFGTFGSRVFGLFKEVFNFGKIIREGAGGIKEAVATLFSDNPFEGVGTKASEAFKREFDKANASVEVNAKIVPEGGGTLNLGGGDDTNTDSAAPFVDPEVARKKAEAEAKAQIKLDQDIAKARLAAMREGVEKQLALEEARFSDLMEKLNEYGIDSSEAIYQNELNKFEIKQKFLEDAANLEGLSGQDRVQFIYDQTKAEIDALETALREAGDGELVAEQIAQINLLRKQATEEYLTQLGELQDAELKQAQQHEINLLELRRDEFESQADFELFKQKEILDIKLEYAEKQLAILEKLEGAESDAVLALRGTINSIKGELAGLTDGNTAKQFSVYSLLGIDPEDSENAAIIEGLETAAATTIDVLTQINKVRLETAEAAIKAKDESIAAIEEDIEAKEKQLEDEEALAATGAANNADAVREEIELLKAKQAAEKVEREKALKEKQKIQRQQAIIDTITQGSSLISAAAQIFNSVAAIPFVGPVIGAGLVAAMLGSFVAAKAKVFQNISAQKAEKGFARVLDGRRHSQGGELVEAEAGEALGILSRGATRQHGSDFVDLTNAMNKGDKIGMAKIAEKLAGGPKINPDLAARLGAKEAAVVAVKNEVIANVPDEELRRNNDLLEQLVKQGKRPKRSTEYRDGLKITRFGNSTRVTRKPK